jgi:hypothetical protein
MVEQHKPDSNSCRVCHLPGHFAKNCPDAQENHKVFACYNCGEEGHNFRNCSLPKKQKKSEGPVIEHCKYMYNDPKQGK